MGTAINNIGFKAYYYSFYCVISFVVFSSLVSCDAKKKNSLHTKAEFKTSQKAFEDQLRETLQFEDLQIAYSISYREDDQSKVKGVSLELIQPEYNPSDSVAMKKLRFSAKEAVEAGIQNLTSFDQIDLVLNTKNEVTADFIKEEKVTIELMRNLK